MSAIVSALGCAFVFWVWGYSVGKDKAQKVECRCGLDFKSMETRLKFLESEWARKKTFIENEEKNRAIYVYLEKIKRGEVQLIGGRDGILDDELELVNWNKLFYDQMCEFQDKKKEEKP